jgi:hypothetical protein
MLPMSFLSEQGDRLAGLYGQAAIGDNYRDLFTSSVWVYSLHAYVALVREHMGDEVAEAVWSRQREMLDQAEARAGQSLESAFRLIDGALDSGGGSPGDPEDTIRVLPETRVALALLLGMPESPAYVSRIDERSERIRTMQVEGYLARCLFQAREELLAACSELFARKHAGR